MTIFETKSSGHTFFDHGTIRRLSTMLIVDEKAEPSSLEIGVTRPPIRGPPVPSPGYTDAAECYAAAILLPKRRLVD